MSSRHSLSPDLDPRLLSYASDSFNSYQAVYGIQQVASLLPAFVADLRNIKGRDGIGDARRAWGVLADLVGASIGVAPTLANLIDLNFLPAAEVGYLIPYGGDFSLAGRSIFRHIDFRGAVLGDLDPLLQAAVEHDLEAKPLLEGFQEELRAYDVEAASAGLESEVRTFRDLARRLSDCPTEFPYWDGRPMFIEEQKAFLDYLSKSIGAEIVAHALVDEPLGEFLLRNSGLMKRSDFTGHALFDVNKVSHDLLKRPVELVCHQVGNAAINALKLFDQKADVLERLFVVEQAVKEELGLDITLALANTREMAVDRHVRSYLRPLINLDAVPYEFPELSREDFNSGS